MKLKRYTKKLRSGCLVKGNKGLIGLILVVVIVIGGIVGINIFLREYKEPLVVEANPNETLIVAPLEGDNLNSQAKLDSVAYLEEQKVATKRVELGQRWLQTGRLPNSGGWIPKQQAIKVDRTPVNLEWTADSNRGSSSANQGIIGEDKNSVSFSVNWYVTATVLESEAHKYLYWYGIDSNSIMQTQGYPYSVNARQLKDVVDTEVRRMVSKLFAEETGKRSLDEIMSSKEEISNIITDKIVEHFGKKGIEITASGWTGDINYFDPQVQEAINKEFKAGREAKAQKKVNQMNLEMAENEVRVAEQERMAAEERQKAWDIIQQRRELDIMEDYVNVLKESWDGKYPTTMLNNGGGSDQPFIMELPMPSDK
jgi:hypothetical protein